MRKNEVEADDQGGNNGSSFASGVHPSPFCSYSRSLKSSILEVGVENDFDRLY
jgi:hypothetical protein